MLSKKLKNYFQKQYFFPKPCMIGNKIVDIANILAKENIGAIIILEKEKVVGILSERDIVRGFTQKKSVRNCKAQELMTKNVYTCSLEDNNENLLTLMVKKHFRHLPVIDKNKLTFFFHARQIR